MARAVWRRADKLSKYYSARGNLCKLLSYYQDEMEPRCVNYLVGPPSDVKTKERAFRFLHEWVKLHFLNKVDHSAKEEDQFVRYTTKRRIEEAKCLLARLKEGMS